MQVYIETERLYIRPLTLSDEDGMFEMDSDPEVHKFLGNRPLENRVQSREMIEFIMRQYDEFGIGRWAIIEKATNDFVGWTGHKMMKTPVNGHVDFIDFGYRLASRFWGKGYATESGKASLHYGIEKLGLKNIYGMTDIKNTASMHVLEKIGLKYIETFGYDGDHPWRKKGEPTTWYQWIEPGITIVCT